MAADQPAVGASRSYSTPPRPCLRATNGYGRIAECSGWIRDVALTASLVGRARGALPHTHTHTHTHSSPPGRDPTTAADDDGLGPPPRRGLEHSHSQSHDLSLAPCARPPTRAWQRRVRDGASTGPEESAQADLDEAWEIADRGPMPLHQADAPWPRRRLR